MAIFRDFTQQKRDRTASDRNRHKELVKKKIREGIADIIAEESIIGKSRNKVIKVPIRGIKEYQFIYGENGKGVSQGNGSEQKGQVISRSKGENLNKSGEAGNQPGEDIYETEITMDEAINMMFEDLELPQLERKKYFEMESEALRRLLGYQRKGIRNRLSKRRTLKNKLKRKNALKKRGKIEEPFPFHNDDLVYRRLVTDVKYQSNAVVFCIMDVSGSMDQIKKYLARSFYFMLYQFIKTRYRNTEIVFIAHHTEAREVSENDFFHKVESGGTFISSGYKKTLEIIEERFNPELWNIYAFHCSDGDNFDSDNKSAMEAAQKLTDICNLFGYGEIKPISSYDWSSMLDRFKTIQADNFVSLKIRSKEDIWPTFKKFLTLDKNTAETT
ncbi:MAG: YeaH/YhbH family protein [Candidatus Cyclobacteriaceae bacterium M3_2C_046]